MIEQLKKQMTSGRLSMKQITALLIFGAIIVVFVLFGFQGKHTAMGVGAAARVNNAYVSVADFRFEMQRMEQMYGQFFGGQMNSDAQRQFIAGQAMDAIVSKELISQATEDQGILITDTEVRDFILNEMPVFKQNGFFQKETYKQILEANHLSPADFENKVRNDKKNQRVQRIFEIATKPNNIELNKLKALKENKINVAFAGIDTNQIESKLSVADSEVVNRLKEEEFLKKAEAEFNATKSSYTKEPEVHASHILIKFDKNKDSSEKAALEKIKDIQKKAETEDFGKLASEYSEDSGSKVKKGDLGFFSKGKMVPEFEAAAFTLPIGKVSAPIKTTYGYHLIKVLEKKEAINPDFQNFKTTIAKKLIVKEKVDGSIKEIEELLKNTSSKENTQKIEESLKRLQVMWSETGYFDLTVDSVPKLSSKVASQAVFEVSEKNPLLNRLVLDGNTKYLIKFIGAKKEPVEGDKNLIAQINRERSNEVFSDWIEQMKKTATIEKNPALLKNE